MAPRREEARYADLNLAGRDWFFYDQDEFAATHPGYPIFEGAYLSRKTETDAVGGMTTLPFADGKADYYMLSVGAYSTKTGVKTGYYDVEFRTTESGVLVLQYYLREAIDNPNVPADISKDFVKSALPDWVFEP